MSLQRRSAPVVRAVPMSLGMTLSALARFHAGEPALVTAVGCTLLVYPARSIVLGATRGMRASLHMAEPDCRWFALELVVQAVPSGTAQLRLHLSEEMSRARCDGAWTVPASRALDALAGELELRTPREPRSFTMLRASRSVHCGSG